MESKDLRIGNYIMQDGKITCVEKLSNSIDDWDDWDDWDRTNGKRTQDYQPIPLTEEWHNKFGVQKNGFMSFEYVLQRKNNIDVKVVFQGDYVFLRQGLSDVITIWNKDLTKRDMYVHEWQNLYFALTGEELTTKK
jgi:hypothetical protein